VIFSKNKKVTLSQAIWSVGMPSGHSAFFTSLTTLIGLRTGYNSPIFAVTLIFSLTYIFDLMLIHKVAKDKIKDAKGKLGHSLSEVIAGIIVGLLVTKMLSQ